ncbi:hypothetical protein [Bacterioplanoides sp.]|uniref:hypothetical protein n=1 Tax=Bacterioplanoides sp. TaxID=2066072 RepID=UPI003AFFCD90
MKYLVASIIFLASFNAFSAKEIVVDIDDIGIRWGKGCITLSSGHTLHTNLENAAGRSEYSTALAAFSMEKSIVVYIQDTKTPNICNVTEVTDHGMIFLKR